MLKNWICMTSIVFFLLWKSSTTRKTFNIPAVPRLGLELNLNVPRWGTDQLSCLTNVHYQSIFNKLQTAEFSLRNSHSPLASQEIPCLMDHSFTNIWTRADESSPYAHSYFLKLHLNVILPCTPSSLKMSCPFRFSNQNSEYISHLAHLPYTLHTCIYAM